MMGLTVIVAVIAIALPPIPTAVALLGADSARVGAVAIGLWLWKALLLAHMCLLWVWLRRTPSNRRAGTPVPGQSPSLSSSRDAGPGDGWLTSRRALIGLGSIMTVGLVLRVIGLGEALWFDEIKMYARYMTQPLGVILATYDDQNQHILYSVLARLSIGLFGDSVFALRAPAVLFGVASLGVLYAFGTRVTSRAEALLATALLAASYHHVWFSQNARGYTGLLFWTLLSTALFLDLLRNRDRSRWGLSVAYAGTVALAVYTHPTAAVLPLSHALVAAWALWRPGRSPEERPSFFPLFAGLVLAGTFTLQLYAPVLPQVGGVLLEPSLSGVSIEWKNPLWLVSETFGKLAVGVPGGALVLLPAMAVALYGAWSYFRRSSVDALAMVLPVVATATAIIALGHNLWPRFFFFAAGFGLLIGLRGLFALAPRAGPRGPAIAVGLAVLAIFGSLTTVPSAWGPKQDYEAAEAFVDLNAGSSDAVVTVGMTGLPYNEWKARSWTQVTDATQLADVEESHERTWLIYSFPTSFQALQPDVWRRVDSLYREAARYSGTLGGGDIWVMVRE
ncbi:MAG: glycosyltransferase family 39 protein [Gemmatimonadota bacterium]